MNRIARSLFLFSIAFSSQALHCIAEPLPRDAPPAELVHATTDGVLHVIFTVQDEVWHVHAQPGRAFNEPRLIPSPNAGRLFPGALAEGAAGRLHLLLAAHEEPDRVCLEEVIWDPSSGWSGPSTVVTTATPPTVHFWDIDPDGRRDLLLHEVGLGLVGLRRSDAGEWSRPIRVHDAVLQVVGSHRASTEDRWLVIAVLAPAVPMEECELVELTRTAEGEWAPPKSIGTVPAAASPRHFEIAADGRGHVLFSVPNDTGSLQLVHAERVAEGTWSAPSSIRGLEALEAVTGASSTILDVRVFDPGNPDSPGLFTSLFALELTQRVAAAVRAPRSSTVRVEELRDLASLLPFVSTVGPPDQPVFTYEYRWCPEIDEFWERCIIIEGFPLILVTGQTLRVEVSLQIGL